MNQTIQRKKILVIGDAMLDIYYMGKVTKISAEAPVPVFETLIEKYYPGGASNVAALLSQLMQEVTLLSVIKQDLYGEKLFNLLEQMQIDVSHMLYDANRMTTAKIRLIDGISQLFRVDKEIKSPISSEYENKLILVYKQLLGKTDLILLSDYHKGVLTSNVVSEIIQMAKREGKKVLADIKDKDYKKYANAFLVKLNAKELNAIYPYNDESKLDMYESAIKLRKELLTDYCLVTCGKNGMFVVNQDDQLIDVEGKQGMAVNVSGAGDLVLAVLGYCLANKIEIQRAVEMANEAAGIKVLYKVDEQVSMMEIMQKVFQTKIKNKLIQPDQIESLLKLIHNQKVIFTNGCFDVLHPGHIHLLKAAKKEGDVLIVGINSDYSIRQLKGTERPFYTLQDRISQLEALSCIDFIIPFDDLTPEALIRQIVPDVLVKGSDYKKEDVIGKDIVEKHGGKVLIVDTYKKYSTTNILKNKNNRNCVY